MKIRQAFVANSSSSSFICEICSHTESGWDASPRDFEMIYCEQEHLVCIEHLLEGFEDDEDEDGRYTVSSKYCPICQFECISNPAVVPYLVETRGITRDEVFASIKLMNKRRKKLYDNEYVKYVFDKCELTEELLLEELKNKFKTYKEFANRG
jgi:hypothetical protein